MLLLRTVEATQKLFDEWAKTYDENFKKQQVRYMDITIV
ncbi:hypothetical protein KQ3_01634 [Bacillus cereus B5-2]|nr:hypothetical protein ICS_03259 [Bacillus cereus BAG2O-3]EOQ12693.1 hypothetical protein KQ3_01634 [Bacillus cereus B5-2]